jgi:PAP2 superfamily
VATRPRTPILRVVSRQVEKTTGVPTTQLRWWKEIAIIGAFYGIYSFVRNQFGSARTRTPLVPFENALHVIRFESAIGLYREHAIQSAFLGARAFLQFWNTYYGTAHFIVTIATFIVLFRRAPARFVRWRNALAFTTALALVGFSLFPLMPPRLLSDTGTYGGAKLAAERKNLPGRIDFVDTLKEFGGPWDFDSGAMTKISNQYAAMPSLHCAWATWCALALWPLVRRRWSRALVIAYPFVTLFCIIVTANHFWVDGIGGLITLAAGWWAGNQLENWNQKRLSLRNRPSAAL